MNGPIDEADAVRFWTEILEACWDGKWNSLAEDSASGESGGELRKVLGAEVVGYLDAVAVSVLRGDRGARLTEAMALEKTDHRESNQFKMRRNVMIAATMRYLMIKGGCSYEEAKHKASVGFLVSESTARDAYSEHKQTANNLVSDEDFGLDSRWLFMALRETIK